MDKIKNMRYDLPASIVVFLVAVPLCLGIALASGAPLFAGIIAGVIGGIVVGSLSGSALGVSGPAAGLAVVVLNSIAMLGSWETFLLSVFIAGILQIIAGFLGGGAIAYYFPSAVIKGMLTGIGLMIIVNQIPHALGYDASSKGIVLLFDEFNHQTILADLARSLHLFNPGAILIAAISLAILIFWDQVLTKKYKIFTFLQGPFVVIIVGILLNWCFQRGYLPFSLTEKQVVDIPVSTSLFDFYKQLTFPDFSQLTNVNVYKIACTVAIIASLETLLSVEAIDKLDPYNRVTPTNRELKAQGVGNMISGLIGGLPITQVIVRSSANLTFGARTKMATIYHGILLLLCTITLAHLLNMIPFAALSAILFVVGYKLAKPSLFVQMYKYGMEQFLPFITTIIGIMVYDLLIGVILGMAVSILFIVKHNYHNSHRVLKFEYENGHYRYHIDLAEEVSFLNKGRIFHELNQIPSQSHVCIDASNSKVIDRDVIELIHHFETTAKTKNIIVEIKGIH